MSVLDIHRQSPTAVLTSVFYEPVESVKEGMSASLPAYLGYQLTNSWRETAGSDGQELVGIASSPAGGRK